MGKEDARADSRKRLRESGSQTDGEDEADGHYCEAFAKYWMKSVKSLTKCLQDSAS